MVMPVLQKHCADMKADVEVRAVENGGGGNKEGKRRDEEG
jgi:hypothetical protein